MKKKYVLQLEHWFIAELEAHTPVTERRGFNRCHLLVHPNNSSIIKKGNICRGRNVKKHCWDHKLRG